MNTTIRNYETLYIIDATLADEQIEAIVDRYAQIVKSQGGEVQAAGKWDKRRLAYEVKGRREGTYILMYFLGEPAVVKELDRVFRIADDVFRFLITRVEPEHVDTTRIIQPQPSAETIREAPAAVPAPEAPAVVEAAAVEAPVQETAPAEEAPAAEPVAEEPAAEAAAEPTGEATE